MNKVEARPGPNQNGHSILMIQEAYHSSASLSNAVRELR